jgi:NTE family protein
VQETRPEPPNEAAALSAHLAATEFFGHMDPPVLDEFAARLDHRHLSPGDALCHAGDPGNSAFVVISGRFRILADGRTLAEAGPGDLVGEISLLTGEARTATVVAMRDSEAVELRADVFADVLDRYPECYQVVSQQLVQRLRRVLTASGGPNRALIVAVLHPPDDTAATAAGQLTESLRLTSDDRLAVISDRDAEVGVLEFNHSVVAICPDPNDIDLQRWAAGQADVTIYVTDVTGDRTRASTVLAGIEHELVLLHPPNTTCPSDTVRWLTPLRPANHHHVRLDRRADLRRVVRRIRSQEVVLVLSGGGARGMAHSGLYQALTESGIELDAVAGVSSGAIGAAMIAMGYDAAKVGRRATELFSEGGSPIDFTIPAVALSSGARLNARLKTLCGETLRQEDMWIPTVFVSANLTEATTHVHSKGLVWRALRATTAIPGVFPPVAEPEGLLVDGGVIDNLPVALVRDLHPGATVIASNVGRRLELSPDLFPSTAEVSGWRAARSRLGRGESIPSMVRILAQLTTLGGAGSAQALGDLNIEFDLDAYGMFDFKRGPEIVADGYAQSRGPVAEWAAKHPRMWD